MKRVRPSLIVLLLLLATDFALVDTQARPVQLNGRVQWIAGQKLMLKRENAPSVTVDLTRVPLDQHSPLAQGDPVRVTGALSDEGRRVVATAIERGERGPQAPR